MGFSFDEKAISRVHLIGTVLVVGCLVLGLGFFFVRQITAEAEDAIRALEVQELQKSQDLLVQQVETAKGFLTTLRLQTEEVLKHEIREQVDEAHALAQAIYDQEKGRRSEEDIKRLITEALRPLRFFDGKGYFFIDGMDGSCVLLPIGPSREGSSLLNNRDDTGHYIMRGLIEAARKPVGEGYSRYRWYAPGDPEKMAAKIAYVRHFAPFDWLIGTGQYVAEVEDRLKVSALDRIRLFRFGRDASGYIVVIDDRERILVSPSRPWNEGKTVSDLEPEQRNAARPIVEQGRKGDGFIRYDWAREGGSGAVSTKLSYVSRLEDWNWTLAAGVYLDEISVKSDERRAALARSIEDKRKLTLAALAIGLGVALAAGIFFSRLVARLVARYKLDLTHQNDQLRRSARDLFLINSIVDSSAELAFLADGEWNLIYANPFALEKLGWSLDQMSGRRLDAIADSLAVPAADGDRHSWRFEAALPTHDGRALPVEVLARDLLHEGVLYHVALARDITERQRWEADLCAKTAQLEHSNADLEQFAYVASHDLREPLRMVSSYLSLLERRYGQLLDSDGLEFLGFAKDGAQRLDRLVLDLLEFSRIDRRGSPLAPMPVRPAVDVAARNLSVAMAEGGATLVLEDALDRAVVLGDSGQITRLLQNLIGNAIKYRSDGRPPRIVIGCRRDGACWELSVSDNGIGIEPQYFERIFGIFQRLHTRDRFEGTGIGLAIAKKIVERHGGRIWVDSRPGEGSSFHFTLPAAAA
ncbi:cache domain-containing protein [Paramagnetospirillum magneticum]|uniref:histidine kinase n=1 Tax=Paramagnetospirillum magneticum (strain ATCC 700264 / AMB-1) TaxID=342108 RepID=Q2W7G1_PARM1|nr:cache domain-containing protein [Paramagnetospirillum magneticum]BAE50214.1 Signal transduction histidine kinase [Paramagnetospirillum magneticum AMB-1]